MYNLDDLEGNLKTLIKQLQQIQQSVTKPVIIGKNNSKSILVKMPKIIMLSDVCSYLTIPEIHQLSNTCKALRNTIYGPIGWKILTRTKTPYPIQLLTPKTDLQKKLKKIATQGSDFYSDDFEDEKFIYQQRTKFKKLLMKKFEDYQKSKQKYQAHKQKIRIETSQIFKMKQQYLYYAGIRDQLQEQNTTHKDKLKKISEGFDCKIKQMDSAYDQLAKQRTKLQNQKQALASKVREYQNQIQIIKEESQKSKTILKRIKNYLVHNQL